MQKKRNIKKTYHPKIAVIGLGYVGLPVAIAFSKIEKVIAFDKSKERIKELTNGIDNKSSIEASALQQSNLLFTDNPNTLAQANFYIIAVPTPVNSANQPDLTLLLEASKTVGKQLKKSDIVVYESTVYPGTTEEKCIPVLEKSSKLKAEKDFMVGYSPERINPGDKEHNFSNIVKVVAGQNENITALIAHVYQLVVTSGIYCASSIKVAEAAKVIENTQRDLNVALINELALICHKLGIDTHEVLCAAKTKWNFLPFAPGLVGGHCIGVDPYYLTYKAQQLGYQPKVILAGRRINDSIGKYIAKQTLLLLKKVGCSNKKPTIAILGLAFKENCNDIRNSKVVDIIKYLNKFSVNIKIVDPLVQPEKAKSEYDITMTNLDRIKSVDAIIIAVSHDCFKSISVDQYANLLSSTKVLIDVKGMVDKKSALEAKLNYWRL